MTKGSKVPLPNLNTLQRWFREGKERGLAYMFIVYDPLQPDHYPVYIKKGEDVAKRFRSFFKDTDIIIVEFYFLDKEPPGLMATPRNRLATVPKQRVLLGMTWDEVGSHTRVVGKGNR